MYLYVWDPTHIHTPLVYKHMQRNICIEIHVYRLLFVITATARKERRFVCFFFYFFTYECCVFACVTFSVCALTNCQVPAVRIYVCVYVNMDVYVNGIYKYPLILFTHCTNTCTVNTLHYTINTYICCINIKRRRYKLYTHMYVSYALTHTHQRGTPTKHRHHVHAHTHTHLNKPEYTPLMNRNLKYPNGVVFFLFVIVSLSKRRCMHTASIVWLIPKNFTYTFHRYACFCKIR